MRAISQYTNYVIQIRPQRSRALGDGGVEVTQEAIIADFTPVEKGGFLYENEKEAAAKHFTFPGLTQHEDQATPSDPIYRMSVFDTDEAAKRNDWDEDTRVLVEAELRRKASTTPQALMVVTETPIQAPFPLYDTYDGEPDKLVLSLVEQGHDLEQVLYYEQVFGPKRPEIIEALEMGVEAIADVRVTA